MREKLIENHIIQLSHQEELIYMKHGIIVRYFQDGDKDYIKLIGTTTQIIAAVQEIERLTNLDQAIDAIQDKITAIQYDATPTLERYKNGCDTIFTDLRALRGKING